MTDQRAAARIIDGRAPAARLRARIAAEVAQLREWLGLPGLAVVLLFGFQPTRLRNRRAPATAEANMHYFEHCMPDTTSGETIGADSYHVPVQRP
jgi:methylenetetrahydrofolate dehydrogenase (NADP+) / methenyltetrahydrofolate cyclohydrolase